MSRNAANKSVLAHKYRSRVEIESTTLGVRSTTKATGLSKLPFK